MFIFSILFAATNRGGCHCALTRGDSWRLQLARTGGGDYPVGGVPQQQYMGGQPPVYGGGQPGYGGGAYGGQPAYSGQPAYGGNQYAS
jgi:hypothetical protein